VTVAYIYSAIRISQTFGRFWANEKVQRHPAHSTFVNISLLWRFWKKSDRACHVTQKLTTCVDLSATQHLHGRRKWGRGGWPAWILKISAEKVVLLV